MHGKRYEENKHTELAALGDAVMAYAEERVRISPPLDQPMSQDELDRRVGQTITPEGFGGIATMRMFAEDLAPTCLSTDHPRYLSFIPCAPSDAAVMFDLVVGASSIYAGSWLEGSGAVFAENQALRWIADLVGMPAGAGGVFTPGGTIGNLSALVSARHSARRTAAAGIRPNRVAATAGAHSSISSACDVMDAELVGVPVGRPLAAHRPRAARGARGQRPRDLLRGRGHLRHHQLRHHRRPRLGGRGVPRVRALVPRRRCLRRRGTGRPLGARPLRRHRALRLVHRRPAQVALRAVRLLRPALPRAGEARAAHTQRAGYLDVLTEADEWNPTDYSVGLTRRARGLPFWFSLAVNGTDAYEAAIEHTLDVARFAEAQVRARPELELVRDRDLSVVVFRRRGWSPADYQKWSDRMLAEEFAFVVPTTHDGETLARFAIVNPETSEDDITAILDTMV